MSGGPNRLCQGLNDGIICVKYLTRGEIFLFDLCQIHRALLHSFLFCFLLALSLGLKRSVSSQPQVKKDGAILLIPSTTFLAQRLNNLPKLTPIHWGKPWPNTCVYTKVQCKAVKNTTSLLSINSVVNKTTCFGLLGGHHQVHQVLAIGD